jgi:hypothetical protein
MLEVRFAPAQDVKAEYAEPPQHHDHAAERVATMAAFET